MKMISTSYSNSSRRNFGYAIGALLIVVAVVGIRYFQAEAASYDESDLQRWSTVSGIDVDGWPTNQFFLNWVGGDGQVFAAFTADPIWGGRRVLVPEYRFTRAGYSWLAAAVTFGVDEWVPYGLFLVNAISVAYVAFIAFSRREAFGPRIWWLLANPALYIAIMSDTAEALGIALLVWALTSGSLAAAGVLATVRPSFLMGLLGRPRQFVVGALVAIMMRVVGGVLFESEATSGLFNITWPLGGYFEEPSGAGLVVAGAAVATFIIGITRRRAAWIGAGLLVMMFAALVSGGGAVNAFRAAGVLPVIWALDPVAGGSGVDKERDPLVRAPLACI